MIFVEDSCFLCFVYSDIVGKFCWMIYYILVCNMFSNMLFLLILIGIILFLWSYGVFGIFEVFLEGMMFFVLCF